jgi:cytochrome c oxidase subunit 2
MAAIDIIDTVGFHAMSGDLEEAAVLSGIGPVIGVTAAIDAINSTGFHGLQEEIEAAAAFEDVSPRDLGKVQNALWASNAAPWPEGLAESVAAFEADAQALVDALTAGDLAAAQTAAAGAHHTQHTLSDVAFEWLAEQSVEAGEGLIAAVGVTAAIDFINSTGFHGLQEEIEAAAAFEDVSPRDLGKVQNALWASAAAPWPAALAESVAAFEADAQALVDALTDGDLAAAQTAAAGAHHTQHSLSGAAFEWLAEQPGETGEGLIAAVGVTAAIDFIDSTGFHGLQEEIEAAAAFEEVSPRDLGKVQNSLWACAVAPWPEVLAEGVAAFEADAQALVDALTDGDLAAAQTAAAGAHHTQHSLSGAAFEWLGGQNGADLLAGLINSRYLGKARNALTVTLATPWEGGLVSAADVVAADLHELVEGLEAGDVAASAEAAHAIHGSQHDLSHNTYEWLAEQSGTASQPDAVLAAIDIIDSTGFHGMQEEIQAAAAFEDVSSRDLGKVEKALSVALVVTWPSEISADAELFIADAGTLVDALGAADLVASQTAAEAIHGSQHDLSYGVYHWLGEQSGSADGTGAVIAVIDIIDSAGFHGMQEEIEAAQSMEDVSPRDLGKVQNAIAAAELVTWPGSLNDAAQDFLADAQVLADALDQGDLAAAQAAAGGIHHTQHSLSNEVYAWLSEQGGGTSAAEHDSSEAAFEHSDDALPDEYVNATVIPVEVSDWAWNPDTITLKKGEPVVLEITNVGVMPHGIWIPALAINVDTPPGEVTQVALTPQEFGEFMLGCNDSMCGTSEQHAAMTGTVMVTE